MRGLMLAGVCLLLLGGLGCGQGFFSGCDLGKKLGFGGLIVCILNFHGLEFLPESRLGRSGIFIVGFGCSKASL